MDRAGIIGYDNHLIFDNPADLEFFKVKTQGHVCIMGRKTFESIGKILPKRQTLVITHNVEEIAKQIAEMKLPKSTPLPMVSSEPIKGLKEAVESYGDCSVFICGGAGIYKLYKSNIATYIATVYNCNVEELEEPRLLPEDYDPAKLTRVDTRFRTLMQSVLDIACWKGIKYRVIAYTRGATRKMSLQDIEEANRDSNFYEYERDHLKNRGLR
jgi:dihydrofolate reductase